MQRGDAGFHLVGFHAHLLRDVGLGFVFVGDELTRPFRPGSICLRLSSLRYGSAMLRFMQRGDPGG
jgi:hypothetical protein